MCLPSFSVMRVILKHATIKNVSILLKVKRIDKTNLETIDELCILYKFNQISQSYKGCDNIQTKDGHLPTYIIEAVSIDDHNLTKQEFRNTLLEKDLTEIILMNFAAHPQYAAQNKHIDPPHDPLREIYKQKAHQEGFANANPKLCLFYHVYCDLIKHQL